MHQNQVHAANPTAGVADACLEVLTGTMPMVELDIPKNGFLSFDELMDDIIEIWHPGQGEVCPTAP